MYTARDIKLSIILRFSWRTILFFFLYSTFISCLYIILDLHFIALPFLPVGLIGTAVAFYVGFKNNSSYERLWEARKIWGSIVNTSRTFGAFVVSYLSSPDPANEEKIKKYQQELIYRHLAFINALRIRLRSRSTWDNDRHTSIHIVEKGTPFKRESLPEGLLRFLPEAELKELATVANPVTQILKNQSLELKNVREEALMDDFRHMEFGKIINELYNQQGACERIKSFPFPRQYAFYSKVFVWIFILILPLGLVAEFSKLGESFVWLTVPFHIIIAWVFNTMEVVGDTSENPFENGINDIPMTSICRNIEIDLREILQEKDLPKPITAANNILM